jgi:hypothetical protein
MWILCASFSNELQRVRPGGQHIHSFRLCLRHRRSSAPKCHKNGEKMVKWQAKYKEISDISARYEYHMLSPDDKTFIK